jgi:hypothetical protein
LAADDADEVDGGLGEDAGRLDHLIAGGVESDGEAAPVGVDVGSDERGVADGCEQRQGVGRQPGRAEHAPPTGQVHEVQLGAQRRAVGTELSSRCHLGCRLIERQEAVEPNVTMQHPV